MRLWTIQTKGTWTRAEESGVLECTDVDADKEIDRWLRPAYDWMVRQLERRVRKLSSQEVSYMGMASSKTRFAAEWTLTSWYVRSAS